MSSTNTIAGIEELLKSKFKLERDKGVMFLRKYIVSFEKNATADTTFPKPQDVTMTKLWEQFLLVLSSANGASEWQPLQGCLSGVKCIIENSSQKIPKDEVSKLQNYAKKLLTHDEVRVRHASGELLGSLCKFYGVETYVDCSPVVLGLIKENLYRELDAGLEPEKIGNDEDSGGRKRTGSVDAATIYHESAGWRHLETSMKCLQFMIEGSGRNFNPYVTQELLDLIFTALSHENRFVRETGYYVCASLVNIGQPDDTDDDNNPDHNSILKYGEQFSKHLADGLADNWSQVRLASSTAARYFLLSIDDKNVRKTFYPILLPRICLNRYYVADGVRIYTQETWRKLSEGKGRDIVEEYIDDVVEYYVKSTQADNHAVREAACACIAELGGKMSPGTLRPHISKLLKTLLECFRDDSWPVRDSACVACGKFILNFADEAKDIKDELYKLFLTNLQDPIASVRQGAAAAIANYVKAYGDTALDLVIKEIVDGLAGIETQPQTTEKFTGLDKSPANFSVVKKLRDNDFDLHSNQIMYSCGSLAPKLGRGKSADSSKNNTKGSVGGCSDCRFQRPSEPWERSDGSVYLISELIDTSSNKSSANLEVASRVVELLPNMVKASTYRHFTQHVVFVETVCHMIPVIGKHLGKRIFKPHLESFFDTIFYALECDTQLTSTAAEECLNSLGTFLGPSILRGRIEACSERYLELYDRSCKKYYAGHSCVGPSPGSLTPFPSDSGFMPSFPTSVDQTMPSEFPIFQVTSTAK